jgi:actin-binding protein IPP
MSMIHTGQIFLTQSTVQEVLVAADMLGLPEVIDACTEYLRTELHSTNAIGIYR